MCVKFYQSEQVSGLGSVCVALSDPLLMQRCHPVLLALNYQMKIAKTSHGQEQFIVNLILLKSGSCLLSLLTFNLSFWSGLTIVFWLKVRSYSALFTVRCGALTHIPLTFQLEYDNASHRTANNAEYELTNSNVEGRSLLKLSSLGRKNLIM